MPLGLLLTQTLRWSYPEPLKALLVWTVFRSLSLVLILSFLLWISFCLQKRRNKRGSGWRGSYFLTLKTFSKRKGQGGPITRAVTLQVCHEELHNLPFNLDLDLRPFNLNPLLRSSQSPCCSSSMPRLLATVSRKLVSHFEMPTLPANPSNPVVAFFGTSPAPLTFTIHLKSHAGSALCSFYYSSVLYSWQCAPQRGCILSLMVYKLA